MSVIEININIKINVDRSNELFPIIQILTNMFVSMFSECYLKPPTNHVPCILKQYKSEKGTTKNPTDYVHDEL